MRKNRMGIVLCIMGIIFGMISLVLALYGADIRFICSEIFLILCFVALAIILNNRNEDKWF